MKHSSLNVCFLFYFYARLLQMKHSLVQVYLFYFLWEIFPYETLAGKSVFFTIGFYYFFMIGF